MSAPWLGRWSIWADSAHLSGLCFSSVVPLYAAREWDWGTAFTYGARFAACVGWRGCLWMQGPCANDASVTDGWKPSRRQIVMVVEGVRAKRGGWIPYHILASLRAPLHFPPVQCAPVPKWIRRGFHSLVGGREETGAHLTLLGSLFPCKLAECGCQTGPFKNQSSGIIIG